MREVLHSLDDISRSTEHARGGTAHLQVVLADLGTVEHGVERCDFIHLHGRHVENLGDLVHCREGEEVVVLLLSDEESRDASGLLVVRGVLVEQILDLSVVLRGELEGSIVIIVLGVSVVRKGGEGGARLGEEGGDCRARVQLSEELS